MIRGDEVYAKSIQDWSLYSSAYDGTQALIQLPGVFEKHERESAANYERRLQQVYGFNFSRAIVDILTFYLFQMPFEPDWGFLKNNSDFDAFLQDCDFWGTGFETFIDARQKQASIYGQVGILIDKPNLPNAPGPDNVVPYLTYYTPDNILDWIYERNDLGKPTLNYLKLQETDQIEVEWTPKFWQRTNHFTGEVDTGANTLGEIPFVWLINLPGAAANTGISDISEIANVDSSIIRNLSQIEEIGDYSAFPMMMKPENTFSKNDDNDTVGPKAVIEFDPAYPNAVPSWLESKAKEPIEALLQLIDKKIEQIYRSANAGGINATEVSSSAKSGTALESEFQLLNAKLATKSAYLEIAQRNIVVLWMKWQNIYSVENLASINLNRPRNFRISDLAGDLEAVIMGTSLVNSDAFNRTMQRIVARRLAGERGDYKTIDEEIETNPVIIGEVKTRAEIAGDRAGAIDPNATTDNLSTTKV